MKCKLCEKFYKDYPLQPDKDGNMLHKLWTRGKCSGWSSPIRCAFDNEKRIFSAEDNWGCQTMGKLREIAEEYGFHYRDDDVGTIGVVPISAMITDGQRGFIVMTWYKERGHVGHAYVINDDDVPKSLTLETAKAVIEYHNKEKE